MGTTTYGLPYPDGTDAPDVPTFMQALAEAVEDVVFEPPRCSAWANVATTMTTSGTTYAIGLDSELFDIGGPHHDSITNPTRITIVRAGLYRLTGALGFAANATGQRTCGIRKGGATILDRMTVDAAAAGSTFLKSVAEEVLAIGDYVELIGVQNSGGSLASSTGRDVSRLSAVWLAKS